MLRESDLKDLDVDESDTHLEAMKRFSDFTKFHSSVLHSPLSIYIRGKYCRSEKFRVIKFLCFKFSCKNIFVVPDTHENFSTVLIDSMFPSLVIWNETAHAKITWSTCMNSLCAAFVATIQLLANY